MQRYHNVLHITTVLFAVVYATVLFHQVIIYHTSLPSVVHLSYHLVVDKQRTLLGIDILAFVTAFCQLHIAVLSFPRDVPAVEVETVCSCVFTIKGKFINNIIQWTVIVYCIIALLKKIACQKVGFVVFIILEKYILYLEYRICQTKLFAAIVTPEAEKKPVAFQRHKAIAVEVCLDCLRKFSVVHDMMRREGITEAGHLQINHNVLNQLVQLHQALLKDPAFPEYTAEFYRTLPYIVELRGKAADHQVGEIETCFTALYGMLMLRLQQKELSDTTKEAVTQISRFISTLSRNFHLDEEDKLFKHDDKATS